MRKCLTFCQEALGRNYELGGASDKGFVCYHRPESKSVDYAAKHDCCIVTRCVVGLLRISE